MGPAVQAVQHQDLLLDGFERLQRRRQVEVLAHAGYAFPGSRFDAKRVIDEDHSQRRP